MNTRAGAVSLSGDERPAAALSVTELRELVREAIRAELAELAPAPALLRTDELAERLACSSSTIAAMRKAGMPSVRLGESFRFELEPCLVWLRVRKP